MIFYRSIILLAVILINSFCSRAQENNYVYKDTAAFYADSVVADSAEPVAAENVETENYVEYVSDTMLRNNMLSVASDSVKALKNWKPFAYAKNLDSLLNEYQQHLETEDLTSKNELSWLDRFFLSPLTKYFFWLLAAVFVSFILYKIFFAEGLFQRSYAKNNVVQLPGETDKLSTNADYGKLILQAVANRNYRIAVRYHHLQSLQRLSFKGAIQFAADKTNLEYLRELSGKTYKNAFASLTLHYEYVWYGAFEIDEDVFNALQHKFKKFNSEV